MSPGNLNTALSSSNKICDLRAQTCVQMNTEAMRRPRPSHGTGRSMKENASMLLSMELRWKGKGVMQQPEKSGESFRSFCGLQ